MITVFIITKDGVPITRIFKNECGAQFDCREKNAFQTKTSHKYSYKRVLLADS